MCHLNSRSDESDYFSLMKSLVQFEEETEQSVVEHFNMKNIRLHNKKDDDYYLDFEIDVS